MNAQRDNLYLMEHEQEGTRIREKTDPQATRAQLAMVGLESGMYALDVGCASGAVTMEMARMTEPATAVGLDISRERLKEAEMLAGQLKIPNVRFKQGLASEIPFDSDNFDFVWSRFLLEYMSDPVAVIKEMKRVAKPGAPVVSADLDGNCLFHYPIEPDLEAIIHKVMKALAKTGFDPWVGRKLYHYYRQAGFRDIKAFMVPHHLIAGAPTEQERLNWSRKLEIVKQGLAGTVAEKDSLDDLCDRFMRLIESPETFTYSPLIVMVGVKS